MMIAAIEHCRPKEEIPGASLWCLLCGERVADLAEHHGQLAIVAAKSTPLAVAVLVRGREATVESVDPDEERAGHFRLVLAVEAGEGAPVRKERPIVHGREILLALQRGEEAIDVEPQP